MTRPGFAAWMLWCAFCTAGIIPAQAQAQVSAPAPERASAPQPPSLIYGELFAAVQRGGVFADSKTFADAVPMGEPKHILAAYRRERATPGFDLSTFVQQHFALPEAPGTRYETDRSQDICAHIDSLWPRLTRGPDTAVAGSSLLPLPHRYVVPGGRFREIYYWDSYFTMLGLDASGQPALVDEMLANFAWLIDRFGHVPNGNRSYYLSRSQPPFFSLMVAHVAAREGDGIFAKYLPQMLREHAFWMDGAGAVEPGQAHRRVVRLRDGTVLNRYWDDRAVPRDESWREDIATAAESRRPAAEVYRNLRAAAESGWDFSSRWFADGRNLSSIRTVDLLPVDLNSLLYELERAIARGFAAKQDATASREWQRRSETRGRAIRAVFWNEPRRTFTDYLWRENRRAAQVTAAGLFPLFVGVADAAQARQAASTLRLTLLRPEGIVPTTVTSGQQWDAPNGWAPLQWIAIAGLRRYDETALADAIADAWGRENLHVFRRTGKMVEKYDVTGDSDARGGEYPNQDGFGWTNGVYRLQYCGSSGSR